MKDKILALPEATGQMGKERSWETGRDKACGCVGQDSRPPRKLN